MHELWDVFQEGQIDSASAIAEATKKDVERTDARLHGEVLRLESKLDGLALIAQALFEILRDKGGITQEEVERKMEEIDLRDGRADGRVSGQPIKCPKCSRPAHTRQRVCMYCSADISGGMLIEKPPTRPTRASRK